MRLITFEADAKVFSIEEIKLNRYGSGAFSNYELHLLSVILAAEKTYFGIQIYRT